MRVEDGETVGIIGPNGHGKSTILKTISGLLTPRQGHIRFDGKDIDGLAPHKIAELGIIHVPEGGRLFPYMTVLENLRLGAYVRHAWRTREKNLRIVFELFPILERLMGRRCSTLSGGERQALAIARGLMSSAKLLMLDEPSLGLSPKLTLEVLEKIKEIKEMGISMILVEQNVTYATEVPDRLYLIEKGMVAAKGERNTILRDEHIRQAYLGMA